MSSAASKCATCSTPVDHPLHGEFHYIKEWNDKAFRAARVKSEQDFEARLKKQKEKPEWSSLQM